MGLSLLSIFHLPSKYNVHSLDRQVMWLQSCKPMDVIFLVYNYNDMVMRA